MREGKPWRKGIAMEEEKELERSENSLSHIRVGCGCSGTIGSEASEEE